MDSSLFSSQGVEVDIASVSKRYDTGAEQVHALTDVTWNVQPGQAVAIMGASGCGKTTLLNLLGGVDHASSGKILVDGQDVTAMNERELEQYRLSKVGFVFQFFNLIPSMTALENLQLPPIVAGVSDAASRTRAEALLGLVGLEGKGDKRPEELSGGEQQRVAVALALANDPAVILADEPTGNLDSRNADVIVGLLNSLSTDYGKTVITVSHDQKVIAQFPVGCAMRDGRLVSLIDEVGSLSTSGSRT